MLAGLTPLTEYLDLTSHFRGERDKNVWSVIVGSFHTLNRIVDAADRPRLAALVRDRLTPAASELGWRPQAGESELTGQLRGDLLRALGTLGDDVNVQARAAESFATHPLDANVFAAVVSDPGARRRRGPLCGVRAALPHGADAAGGAARTCWPWPGSAGRS